MSGHRGAVALGPCPRREAGVIFELPIGQAWRDLSEVADGIEVVECAGSDERVGDGRPVAAAVFSGAEEEVILSANGDGADGPLSKVVVDRQEAGVGVDGERVPQGAGVVYGLAEWALRGGDDRQTIKVGLDSRELRCEF